VLALALTQKMKSGNIFLGQQTIKAGY